MAARTPAFNIHLTHIAGTVWTGASGAKLGNTYQPAMGIPDLPPIDLILLSHEDHKDNLDDLSRPLLDGRRVLTTVDGSQKLAPRKGVVGLRPWEKTKVEVGGIEFEATATPCVHLPGGECSGFILTNQIWGTSAGKPNALYFSGDTIYIEELAKIKEHYHVSIALFNMGRATVPAPAGGEPLQITMDAEQAVRLMQDIEAEIVIPMHFEGWGHFKEGRAALQEVFKKAGVEDRLRILEPGSRTKIA